MDEYRLRFARVRFDNMVLSSRGQSFEDLFVKVMQAKDKGFRPVKPQGPLGDKKNDGFNKEKGQYYQVYSPEDPSSKEKESYKKITETFAVLYDYWKNISPIREFYWVYNDSFKTGVFPTIEEQLAEIERRYRISANPFLCKNLEDVFLSLPDSEIIDILGGFLPDCNAIEDVSIPTLSEVISYLVKYKFDTTKIFFPDEINFDKKIRFNNLTDTYGTLLKHAFYQDYIISEYFSFNGKFVKEDLKSVFSNFYQEAIKDIPDSIPNKSDVVFDSILQKASPRNEKAFNDAVLVLMAHYFESCDIYKEPVEPIQKSIF